MALNPASSIFIVGSTMFTGIVESEPRIGSCPGVVVDEGFTFGVMFTRSLAYVYSDVSPWAPYVKSQPL